MLLRHQVGLQDSIDFLKHSKIYKYTSSLTISLHLHPNQPNRAISSQQSFMYVPSIAPSLSAKNPLHHHVPHIIIISIFAAIMPDLRKPLIISSSACIAPTLKPRSRCTHICRRRMGKIRKNLHGSISHQANHAQMWPKLHFHFQIHMGGSLASKRR